MAPVMTSSSGGDDSDSRPRAQSSALVVAKTATTSTYIPFELLPVFTVILKTISPGSCQSHPAPVRFDNVRFYTEVQEDNWSERAKKHLWMHFRCVPAHA
jgi:hypothetical protein